MPKRRKKAPPRGLAPAPMLEPNAAGVDIGATEIYIAVPPDRDSQPVRRFATFTEDLIAAADWLERCGIKTVAMESTGVYWIAACDVEIEQMLAEFSDSTGPDAPALPEAKDRHKPRRNEMRFDLRGHLYRIFGVDLTGVPGINALTAHTLLSEVGRDLSAFRSAGAFASWMGLCPDNRVSGGKVLSSSTRGVNNRLARALRLAAQSLFRSQSWLGQYYRRMRAKLGAPKAITAAAHKLARIIFHLLATQTSYDESVFAQQEIQNNQRMQRKLQQQAKSYGFQLIEITPS